MRINQYDTNKLPLAKILCDNIGIDYNTIPYIHKSNQTNLLDHFFNSSFEYSYKQFIKNILKPLITNRRIYYNTIPKIYLNLPNNTVNNIYSTDYIHEDQLSVVLPITRMYDTNTFWINDEIPKPYNIDYGEFVIIDQTYKDLIFPLNKTKITSVYISFNISTNQCVGKDHSII